MYNLNWHRSFDLYKLVDARRRAWSERAFRTNYSNNIMTECINVYLTTQPVVRSLPRYGSLRCPSVCHVDVSKRPILLSNFFIAWWLHHSSFPKGDPTEIPTGSPSTGAPNRGRVGLYQKFASFNQYFRNTDTEYRYRLQIPIPSTDPAPNHGAIIRMETEWSNFTEASWCNGNVGNPQSPKKDVC